MINIQIIFNAYMRFLVKETAARHDHLKCDTHDPYFLQQAALNIVTGDVYYGSDLRHVIHTHTYIFVYIGVCVTRGVKRVQDMEHK